MKETKYHITVKTIKVDEFRSYFELTYNLPTRNNGSVHFPFTGSMQKNKMEIECNDSVKHLFEVFISEYSGELIIIDVNFDTI